MADSAVAYTTRVVIRKQKQRTNHFLAYSSYLNSTRIPLFMIYDIHSCASQLSFVHLPLLFINDIYMFPASISTISPRLVHHLNHGIFNIKYVSEITLTRVEVYRLLDIWSVRRRGWSEVQRSIHFLCQPTF